MGLVAGTASREDWTCIGMPEGSDLAKSLRNGGLVESIHFMVQGSASEPYKVTFQKSDGHLSAFCTCPAGESGQHCKHRLRILEGKTDGIVDRNDGRVNTVRSWLPGTELEAALSALASAELELEQAKTAAASAKRRLASAMRS